MYKRQIETFGSTNNYKLDNPYQSWGTEMVIVVTDEPNYISLQHIMMMYFKNDDGSTNGPFIQKHWRQDWQYEPKSIVTFQGFDNWQKRKVNKEEGDRNWSQSVYQVDDSPRYQAVGSWQHTGNHSSWLSGETWRPLPRREFKN